jgi:hypothetical protein
VNALESAMAAALDRAPGVAAVACMDGRAGLVLGLSVRGHVPHELVELAALSAPELCSAPQPDPGSPDEACPDALVTSDAWVHAYARVPERPELVVMGLADRTTNVGLLRAWLGEVAGQVGRGV